MVEERRKSVTDLDQTLVREIYAPLRRFAAVVGPAEVEPDDLVQEALSRVLRRGSLTELDQPVAYLRRTMLNLVSNQRRGFARRRDAIAKVDLDESCLPEYPSDTHDLMQLAPRSRAVLYLTCVEGRTYAEVAELLGCTEVSARAISSRARRKLRAVLSEEEPSATA